MACEKPGHTEFYKDGRCKCCVHANNKRYREKHADAEKSRTATWRVNNKYKASLLNATWRANNPEKAKNSSKEWKKANPDANRVHCNNRRARITSSGKLSNSIAKKLLGLQRGKCACCKKIVGEEYHLDHIMPLALNGPNADENVQILCVSCNQSKHKKHPVDFMQQRGYLL
jgi:5-methylcytosine-specific restriction endonuclease McrA